MTEQYALWLQIAERLSMTVREAMETVTHREYLLWYRYLSEEFNRPSRTDWYLAQIAREVHCVLHKNPSSVKTNSFLMKFQSSKQPKKPTEPNPSGKTKTVVNGIWASLIGKSKRSRRGDGN